VLVLDDLGPPITDAGAVLTARRLSSAPLANGVGDLLVPGVQGGQLVRADLARLTQQVDPRSFGAAGNGVAIDGPALQAAFNYAAANRLPVILRATGAAYLIDQRLIIPNGLNLEAQPGAVIKVADGATIAHNLYWAIGNEATLTARHTGTRIVGLTLDCNRLGNPDYGPADGAGNSQYGWEGTMLTGLALANIDGLVLEGCTVRNATGSGIWITDCPLPVVRDNTVADCRFVGLVLRKYLWSGPLAAGVLTGNRAFRCTVGLHGGIFGLTRANVFGNYAEDCGDWAKWPGSLYNGTYPNVWPKTGTYKQPGQPGYASPAVLGDGTGIEFTGYWSGPANSVPPGAVREQFMAIGPNAAARCQVGLRIEQSGQHFAVVGGTYSESKISNVLIFSGSDGILDGVNADKGQAIGITIQSIAGQDQTARIVIDGCSARGNGDIALLIAGAADVTVTGGQYGGSGGGTGPVNAEFAFTQAAGFSCSGIRISDVAVRSDASWIYSDSLTHQIEILDSDFRGAPATPIGGPGAAGVVVSNNGGLLNQGTRRGNPGRYYEFFIPFAPAGNQVLAVTELVSSGAIPAGLEGFALKADQPISGVVQLQIYDGSAFSTIGTATFTNSRTPSWADTPAAPIPIVAGQHSLWWRCVSPWAACAFRAVGRTV
jgi:hypothetical protein